MASRAAITGKIAQVMSEYAVAINRGAEHGVQVGMIFGILGTGGVPVVDPETGASLGSVTYAKAYVKVAQVHNNWSIATTYREMSASDLAKAFGPTRVVETLQVDKDALAKVRQDRDATVRVGDPVTEQQETTG
jgi:hypothetical protein